MDDFSERVQLRVIELLLQTAASDREAVDPNWLGWVIRDILGEPLVCVQLQIAPDQTRAQNQSIVEDAFRRLHGTHIIQANTVTFVHPKGGAINGLQFLIRGLDGRAYAWGVPDGPDAASSVFRVSAPGFTVADIQLHGLGAIANAGMPEA